MVKKNFLIILVGLPASGKSAFAYKLKDVLEKRVTNFKVKIIDPDNIREDMFSGQFDYNKEQIVRKKDLEEVKKALKAGFIVISDDLNYYTSMRHDLKNIAESLNLKFFIVHVSTPLEICLKWNEKRLKPIPDDVITRINERFDYFGKYKWDNPAAKYDLSQEKDLNGPIKRLIDFIIYNLESLKQIKTNKKVINKTSNLDNQKLDKITRNIVGDLLRNPKYRSLKNNLVKYRKLFFKSKLNMALSELEISKIFKEYLEKNLNTKIS